MAGLNKVMLIGRLGKDPEIMSFENGGKKATFSLATSEGYRDKTGNWQDATEWHNIVAWGNLAAGIADGSRNYAKGDMVYVEGRIKTRNYQDANGNTRYITEINADKINQLLKGGQGSGSGNYTANVKNQPDQAGSNDQPGQDSSFEAPPDDDLPF